MSISQVSRDSTFDMRLSLTSFELSTHLVLSFKFCEFPNHSTFIVLISHESCSATFVSIEAQSRVLSLVGPSGLEPPTSCLSGTRSNLLSYEPMWLVSDFRHLVLSPFLFSSFLSEKWRVEIFEENLMVEMKGFDSRANYALSHSRLWRLSIVIHYRSYFESRRRINNHKSNTRLDFWLLVEMKGFEPLTPCLQGRCSPSWATPPWVGSLIF